MLLYKTIEDGILTAIGESSIIGENQIQITSEEYNNIREIFSSKPEDTDEIVYKLNAETLIYDEYPATPIEEPNPYGIPNELLQQIKNDTIQEVQDAINS